MRVLSDLVRIPALYSHHCLTFSAAILAEFRAVAVPFFSSCSSECKHRKCKYTILLVGGLDPRIASTTLSSKSHILSFLFDLVVILFTLVTNT